MMRALIIAAARGTFVGMSLVCLSLMAGADQKERAMVIAAAIGITLGTMIWTGIMHRAQRPPSP